MPKRFEQKYQPIIELDLHGLKHHEVHVLVEDFILKNQYQLPLRIITGNSNKMKSIETEYLTEQLKVIYSASYSIK